MPDVSPTAAQVISEALHKRMLGSPGGLYDDAAGIVVDALKAAGFAVVKLPSNYAPFRVDEDGDVWDDDFDTVYSPIEAEVTAERLRAAAAAAVSGANK